MSERKAEFIIEERDVVTAMKLASSSSLAVPTPLVLGVGSAVVAVAMYYFHNETNFITNYVIPILIVMLVAVALLQYAVIPWQARRHFQQSAMFSDEITMQWDADGFSLSGKRGQTTIDWSELYRWNENDVALLLYQSQIMFHVIPKRALGQGRADDLIGKIVAAGVKKR